MLRAINAETGFKVGFKLQMYSIEGNKGQMIEKKSVIFGNCLDDPDLDELIWSKNMIEIPVLLNLNIYRDDESDTCQLRNEIFQVEWL